MKLASFILLTSLVVLSCTFGGKMAKSYVANNPGGDNLKLTLTQGRILEGEFLSYQDSSIFFLSKVNLVKETEEIFGITKIPLNIMQSGYLLHADKHVIQEGKLTEEAINLRFYSRYPQGINDEILTNLLEAYNQETLNILN